MKSLSDILKILPWLMLVGILVYFLKFDTGSKVNTITSSTSILQEIENIGKLELVKYNFKEITELKTISPEYLKIFKLGPDSKIALISAGEAVGCIDLTKVIASDIREVGDSIYVDLPKAELCYFKLDLAKTRIYSLQTNPLIDEKEFIKKAYELAESEIRDSAINSGILSSAQVNAILVLRPLLESISGKTVLLNFKQESIQLEQPL